MSRRLTSKSFAAAALGALVAACAAVGPSTRVTAPSQVATGLEVGLSAQPTAGAGGVVIAVQWPERSVQTIPLSATQIDVTLRTLAQATVATASIVRPATQAFLAESQPGNYELDLAARGPAGNVVATASRSITVRSNVLTRAALTMRPVTVPVLTSLDRTEVPIGDWVMISGTSMNPPPGATYSLLVGGQAVPASDVQLGNESLYFKAPAWLTTSNVVTYAIDGIQAEQSLSLSKRLLDHLAIYVQGTSTPVASKTVDLYETVQFVYKAYLDSAGTHEAADVQFAERLSASNLQDSEGGYNYLLGNGRFQGKAGGTVTLRIEAEGKVATASITVRPPVPLPSASVATISASPVATPSPTDPPVEE